MKTIVVIDDDIYISSLISILLEKNGYIFVKEEFGAEDDPYGNGMLIYKKIFSR